MSASNRGAGHVLLSSRPGPASSPEHDRDVSLLQRSYAQLRAQEAARRIQNDPRRAETSRILVIVKGLSAHLSGRPWAMLTERQRAMCMRILGLIELPPLPEAQVPDVLRVLPKKPPGVRA